MIQVSVYMWQPRNKARSGLHFLQATAVALRALAALLLTLKFSTSDPMAFPGAGPTAYTPTDDMRQVSLPTCEL